MEKKYSMKKYFKNIKGYIFILGILMIMNSVLGVLTPIMTANLFTSITDFNASNSIKYAILSSLFAILTIATNRLVNFIYLKYIKTNIVLNIRKDMIKNVFALKIKNFDNHSTGEFSERLKNDPGSISRIFSVVGFSAISMLTDIFVLGYVMYINYIFGIIYIIFVTIIYFYEKYAYKKYEELDKTRRKISDKSSSLIAEIIRGIRDVKLLNISPRISPMINDNLGEATKYESLMNLKSGDISNTVRIIQELCTLLVVLSGVMLVSNNLISLTSFIVVFLYRGKIYDLTWSYTSVKEYLTEYKVSKKRIFEFMDNDNYPKEEFGNTKLSNIKGKIEVKDLSFSYKDKKVLDNFSILINPNDTIGIVGASGSGKTTILNLISKAYEVDDNKIFIDDIDINSLTEDSIRNNISVISQSPYIFNLTIRENLCFMGNKVTEKEMIEACMVAQIHDYIETLPNKYDTILGEGGITLSGGQRQRLAIARALIKKSKIILFDEATSALDNITQEELQKAINNITKDYTIIIVAHRLSTIKDCKKIYVMDKGKIVGCGTHKELIDSNKYYNKLYKKEVK